MKAFIYFSNQILISSTLSDPHQKQSTGSCRNVVMGFSQVGIPLQSHVGGFSIFLFTESKCVITI